MPWPTPAAHIPQHRFRSLVHLAPHEPCASPHGKPRRITRAASCAPPRLSSCHVHSQGGKQQGSKVRRDTAAPPCRQQRRRRQGARSTPGRPVSFAARVRQSTLDSIAAWHSLYEAWVYHEKCCSSCADVVRGLSVRFGLHMRQPSVADPLFIASRPNPRPPGDPTSPPCCLASAPACWEPPPARSRPARSRPARAAVRPSCPARPPPTPPGARAVAAGGAGSAADGRGAGRSPRGSAAAAARRPPAARPMTNDAAAADAHRTMAATPQDPLFPMARCDGKQPPTEVRQQQTQSARQ